MATPTLRELTAEEQEELSYKKPELPEPEINDIWSTHYRMQTDWRQYHNRVRDDREARYLQRDLPNKLEQRFQYAERIYTRLIHNEILRVVAMLTRNRPQVRIPASSTSEKSRARASKQQRWCQELLPYIERHMKKPLWRTIVDHQVGDGLGAFFVYMTDAYDKIEGELEKKLVWDQALEGERLEETREYNRRVDELLQECGLPMGVRWVDPLTLQYEEDEEGVCWATIEERKSRPLLNKILESKGDDPVPPKRGTVGVPVHSHNTDQHDAQSDFVDTLQYWDRTWYAYFVDGRCVEGPVKHHLPGVPIIPVEGMVTGSPNIAERLQGVTWGLDATQDALDSLLSLEMDTALTYGRPIPIVEADGQANVLRDANGDPRVLDFSGPGVRQLQPGQKITDVLKDFHPKQTDHIQQMLLSIWQRSGLNPIAQGESPGADPAGYTVNTLQGAAQSNYEVFLDNLARAYGQLIDFVRLMVRDTVKEKVWLSVPMGRPGSPEATSEWLALAPEDVDETPALVFIDPLSDANRIAKIQMLAQMNKEGMVPRRIVQESIPEIEDPEAADNEIVLDAAEQMMHQIAMEELMERLRVRREQEEMGGVGGHAPEGGQMPPGVPGQGDMEAATPTVGAEQAGASQGPGESRPGPPMMNSAQMRAGQNQGYRPPPGQMTEGPPR